jgi:hypothetical protein
MIIEAQVGEIFGLISLVIDTDGSSLLIFKWEVFVFYRQIPLSLSSQNKFSFIRQMAQF